MKQLSLFLFHCLTAFVFFSATRGQKVPCVNQVLLNDQFGEGTPTSWNDFILDSDTSFKNSNRFSISFWLSQDAIFNIQVQAGSFTTVTPPAQPTFLNTVKILDINVAFVLPTVPVGSPPQPAYKAIILNSSFMTTPISYQITTQWVYVFITFDSSINGSQAQVNLYTINSVSLSSTSPIIEVPSISPIKQPLNSLNSMPFQYPGVRIVSVLSSSSSNFLTRKMYLHRGYGFFDLNTDFTNILKMMMRDNTRLISNYLLNQDILQKYLDDNNDQTQNNIILSNSPANQIPILFYKSLSFSKQNQIVLNGFSMTQIQREFSISFSILTKIVGNSGIQYSILSFQDTSGNSIFQINLQPDNDFQESIWFVLNSQTIQVPNCNVQRVKNWNYFMITGYSYARLQPNLLPQYYYFDVYLDYQFCGTITWSKSASSPYQSQLNSDQFLVVLGNQYSDYSGTFQFKAFKIYQGAYSPFNSACNQFCSIQQSKDLTSAEYQKLAIQLNTSGSTGTTSASASTALQTLSNLTVIQYQTLSCLRCSDQRYMTGEYCVSGASQCTEQIDPSSNQCFPQMLCSDPLHDSSDCIKNCKAGYQIDTTARCSIPCDYSCGNCSNTKPNECYTNNATLKPACPSTRILNTTTKKCECDNSGTIQYFDDGISNECIQIQQSITINTPKSSSLQLVFDILVDTSTKIATASIQPTPIYTSSSYTPAPPKLIFNNGGTTNTVTVDLKYGLQLFSGQYFILQPFTSFMPMKFWVFANTDLGRNVLLLTFRDNTSSIIIQMFLNQVNNFEYSLTVCLYGRCQLLSPLLAKIKVDVWSQIAISLSDFSKYSIDVFINGKYKKFRFDYSQTTAPSSGSISSIQFGDSNNAYLPPQTQFLAIRYISFYSINNYFQINQTPSATNPNCIITTDDDNLCILCQQGFYFDDYKSTKCQLTTPSSSSTPPQFLFSDIQIISTCALNQNICTSCTLQPTNCSVCANPTSSNPPLRDPLKNCDCIDGYYSDPTDYLCKKCSPKCSTCSSLNVCLTCSNNRINPPDCPCPSSFLEPLPQDLTSINQGLCDSCSPSCSSCSYATNSCTCPDLTKTFREQKTPRSCPCKQGYYDETNTNIACKSCFPNCTTCVNGQENQCLSCKVDPSQVSLVVPITGIGQCKCKDPSLYLDYNGFCKGFTAVAISITTDPFTHRPKLKLELTDGQQIENASTSKWTSLLDIRVLANDNNLHNRRNLQTSPQEFNDNNLILTTSNDPALKNVGYINIDVQQSCSSQSIQVRIADIGAVRTINGVPLNPSFSQQIFTFNVSPFILKYSTEDLIAFQEQQQKLSEIQGNGFVSFMRYISLPLFFMNCLQPISSLLLLNTVLPMKSHLLISQFASFVFPHTPVWMNYDLNNSGQNNYSPPPYSIYGASINVSGQTSYSPYQQMGLSANFLINIVETLVLLTINGIAIFALHYLDDSQVKFFQGKRFYQYGISFFLNLVEVRLIYILLSIFLQFTNFKFSNALNGVSAIFSILFVLLYLFFLYMISKVLNSESEKTDFEYKRVQHLIDFLDIAKHSLTLNYKFIQTIKKTIYFFVVVIMYNSPKVQIIFLIILAVLFMIFDILVRPFRIGWINTLKILSSLSWSSLVISVYISFSQSNKFSTSAYIIDSSATDSYSKAGEAIYYLIYIFFSTNCVILLLKCLDMIRILFKYISERDKRNQQQVLIMEKQGADDSVGKARYIDLQPYGSSENDITTESNGFAKITVNKQQLIQTDRFLFNFDRKYVKNHKQKEDYKAL